MLPVVFQALIILLGSLPILIHTSQAGLYSLAAPTATVRVATTARQIQTVIIIVMVMTDLLVLPVAAEPWSGLCPGSLNALVITGGTPKMSPFVCKIPAELGP